MTEIDKSPRPRDWAGYKYAFRDVQGWLRKFETMNEAWHVCDHRPDWLLFFLSREMGSMSSTQRHLEGESFTMFCAARWDRPTKNGLFDKRILPPMKSRRDLCRRIKALYYPKGSPYDDPGFRKNNCGPARPR